MAATPPFRRRDLIVAEAAELVGVTKAELIQLTADGRLTRVRRR